MPESATRLRCGQSVPAGIPIYCCGSPMKPYPSLGGAEHDRQCGSCHRVLVIWNGRVEVNDIVRR